MTPPLVVRLRHGNVSQSTVISVHARAIAKCPVLEAFSELQNKLNLFPACAQLGNRAMDLGKLLQGKP